MNKEQTVPRCVKSLNHISDNYYRTIPKLQYISSFIFSCIFLIDRFFSVRAFSLPLEHVSLAVCRSVSETRLHTGPGLRELGIIRRAWCGTYHHRSTPHPPETARQLKPIQVGEWVMVGNIRSVIRHKLAQCRTHKLLFWLEHFWFFNMLSCWICIRPTKVPKQIKIVQASVLPRAHTLL